jgi:hypothetical protein
LGFETFREPRCWILGFDSAVLLGDPAIRARQGLKTLRKSLRADQFEIVQGGGAAQGTYVDVPTALELCETYGLDILKGLLQMTLREHGYQEESLSEPNPESNPISPSSGIQSEGLQHSTPADERTAGLPKAPSVFSEPSYTMGSFLQQTGSSFLLQRVHPNPSPQEIGYIDTNEIELGSPYGASRGYESRPGDGERGDA